MVEFRSSKNMFYGANSKTFKRAEELRLNMTHAESFLWEHLRRKQILGLRFKAQHPISQFIVDFYCHKAKLIIEVDGEIHQLKENAEYDLNRTYELEKYDLKVIRFSNSQVLNEIGSVLENITEVCKSRIPI